EEHPQVLERGRLVVDERVVAALQEVAGALEGGDEHPVEREGGEERERADDAGVGRASSRPSDPAPAVHQITSVRRAMRRKTTATASSIGNRKTAMAAPSARSPPWMPVKKASVDSTWVVSEGPPRVSTKITIMSVEAKMGQKRVATIMIGRTSGSVI